jgi:hypothetical protein
MNAIDKAKKAHRKKQKAISGGIEKMTREFKDTGEMHTSRATYHPKSVKHAQQIAAAIEYSKERRKKKK